MIFTEKKITISNNQCKIDSPVVLYRGDYNVEVRFSIVSSPYKYSNKQETNVIEQTEASYGQLVIKTPGDKAPIFSEITATKRGAITFTIAAEMIDEIDEVGDYSFQIRLLDENKESRATIPEVKDGIEIREPIAQEDVTSTNEVGVATVGYAMTTAGTTEDAFDSQGNYNKTTWATGDRITAAKLNKLEVAIDGVNKKVASGSTSGEGMTQEQVSQLSTAYQHSQSTHAPSNAEANVQADWNETNTTSDAYIKNKPTIPTRTSELTNNSDFVDSAFVSQKIAEASLSGGEVDLSRWYGKRWLCIGDSITTERGGYAEKSYASMVASNLGLQLTNIAVGGKQLTDALTWVTNLEDVDFDLVTIMMGTNDHAYQGAISNITNNFETVVRKIQQRMPNTVIAYITPIKRVFFDNDGNEADVGPDGYVQNHGTSLADVVDAMKIKCRELSIPCLDIYDTLDPKVEYVRKTYFLREDGKDGTHPNVLGHAKFIAPRVNAFLESIAPFYMYINSDNPEEPTEPGVTTYTITNNLTNCSTNNNNTSVNSGSSYSATLSANSGYQLSTVTVTMGGTNITSTAYSNGNINISSVTGNIVITANATQQSSGESDAVLLHSWNLAGQTTTDSNEKTIYADLTNNFNMIVQNSESIGNDRYYSGGGGLLLEKTDSFTLILNNVQGKTAYPKQLLHTGISSGVNVWGQSQVTPVTKGRFKLIKGADVGNYDLIGTYYAVDKDSTTTSMSFDKTVTIDTGNSYSIKITYDATNTVGKIYVNDELVCTINDSLLIDGIYLSGESQHIGYGEIKLYRGLI